MNNKNIFKIVSTIFLMFIIAGCSVRDIDLGKIIEPEKKEFVYKREKVSPKLLKTVNEIVKAMGEKQLNLINKKYIHPSFGFYNVFKTDGHHVFTQQKQIFNIIEGKAQELSHLISRVPKKSSSFLIQQEDVMFRCSPSTDKFYGWNTEGLYLSDKTNTYLSSMMNEINISQKDMYKEKDFHQAKIVEKMSYKVVLTPEIIFYMTKIDENWYITMFDRISTDCSSIKKVSK